MADRLTLPQPGEVIAGKYRIDHSLGTGGMGAVFQATHRVTGKRFAVKWLLPEVSGQGDAAQRFIREAQVAGRFEHPHVVEVYDLGNDGGSFYMVMELLEGESLAERVTRTGPMTVADTCRLLIPVMHGVAEAHAAGIVHRDLKPANIFVCHATKQRRECAKVLDFGISKISGLPGGDLGGMTKSGTLIGTPHYMPLEQMRGRPVDHRADIYSFGVVVYQVLTGKLPYPAESFSDLVLMLAHETPPPLDQVVPRLPRGVAQIVAKAMAREPADRFQSLDELILALEPYADPSANRISGAQSGSQDLHASLSLPTPLSTESSVRRRSAQGTPVLRYVIAGAATLLLAAGAVFWLQRGAEQAQGEQAPHSVHTATPAPQPPAAAPAAPTPAAEPPLAKPEQPEAVPDQALAPQLPEQQPAAAQPTPPAVTATPRPRPRPETKHAVITPVRPTLPPPEPPLPAIEPVKPKATKSASGRVPAINESDFY
ncbi:MAG TPA: serine/threonine-protein kinase [Polyangiales bacterium]|nr:serine/threonine-protein kinase [Polyangiales bacterium]